MLRPLPARWFELIVAREDAFVALEALAATGAVEVEAAGAAPAAAAAPATQEALRRFAGLARRYGPYWPPARVRAARIERRAPAEVIATAVARLQDWARRAEPAIVGLQRAQTRAAELALTARALQALGDGPIDFAQLAAAREGVQAAVVAAPRAAPLPLPAELLVREAEVGEERLVLALGSPAALAALAAAVADAGGRRAPVPPWLAPGWTENLARLAVWQARCRRRIDARRAQLDQLAAAHDLAHTLGDLARAAWCIEHLDTVSFGLPERDVFARIGGWTIAPPRLLAAIEACGARALVRWPQPPRGARVPLVLRNPAWARPFEVLTRLAGMPEDRSADPSVLLAVAVPLLFGYMFGDLGQGLVLAAVGAALWHRVPVLRLLVPGGLAAAGFGWVFGSVFCLETVLHPLWLPPLAHPLPVLAAPVAGGIALLALGLGVGLLTAIWQHRAVHWLREDLPAAAAYAGVLAAFVDPRGWLLVAAGTAAAVAGAEGGLRGGAGALGEMLERTVQLLINTLSFARVGAFALAHAGLASAVVALADAAPGEALRGVALLLGNLLILLVEGLVVSIQTTRLVLFEFFARFFRGQGRAFTALAPPPVLIEET